MDGGADLSLDLMQRIAREFNQSETTFVMPPTRVEADWRLRSFTPKGVEVFGAGGHNTLGAWWWLAESGKLALGDGETRFHQEIGDRVLPVIIGCAQGRVAGVTMQQEAPVAGGLIHDLGALAASLGLTAADLAADRVPCQVVSTGAAHLLVPIRDRDAVDRAQPDVRTLLAALASVGGEGCYVFSLDPRHAGAAAYARFFNPTVGITEDPATGTAAGPLAAHLVAHGLARPGSIENRAGVRARPHQLDPGRGQRSQREGLGPGPRGGQRATDALTAGARQTGRARGRVPGGARSLSPLSVH